MSCIMYQKRLLEFEFAMCLLRGQGKKNMTLSNDKSWYTSIINIVKSTRLGDHLLLKMENLTPEMLRNTKNYLQNKFNESWKLYCQVVASQSDTKFALLVQLLSENYERAPHIDEIKTL